MGQQSKQEKKADKSSANTRLPNTGSRCVIVFIIIGLNTFGTLEEGFGFKKGLFFVAKLPAFNEIFD